jgi:hypothetical protein
MDEKFTLLECLADDDQWKQWEKEAAELELPLDYYIAEFV